jgi:hypothetical protein
MLYGLFSDADAFCLRIQESQPVEIASQILNHLDSPDKAAVNRLDDPSDSKVVGGSATGSKGVSRPIRHTSARHHPSQSISLGH